MSSNVARANSPSLFQAYSELTPRGTKVWGENRYYSLEQYAVSQPYSLHSFLFKYRLFSACGIFRSRRHKGCRGKGDEAKEVYEGMCDPCVRGGDAL